ncbi:hypothetical protein [Haloglycomyces albus]|uniref:hypothetical protein n=1 Tax=Haloglycomyces albus TaxID=526067 RepID=UPI00046CEAE6|nr:hypothetical protein [Haloglycomyces albus]
MSVENAGMLFVFGILFLIALITVVSIIWGTKVARAKAVAAREERYRELAQKVSDDTAEVKASLVEMKARVAAIEKMLKEV